MGFAVREMGPENLEDVPQMRRCQQWMLVLTLGFAAIAGCSATSANCNIISIAPPVITITDAATGQSICDATVVAQCDDAPDAGITLTAVAANGYLIDAAVPGCHYGADLQPICDHAYTIYVSKTGYEPLTVADVEIRSSTQCPGPEPDAQQVNVMLEPD
jgi:hypothetical protein